MNPPTVRPTLGNHEAPKPFSWFALACLGPAKPNPSPCFILSFPPYLLVLTLEVPCHVVNSFSLYTSPQQEVVEVCIEPLPNHSHPTFGNRENPNPFTWLFLNMFEPTLCLESMGAPNPFPCFVLSLPLPILENNSKQPSRRREN